MFCPPHNDRHDKPYEDEDEEERPLRLFRPVKTLRGQTALDTDKENADVNDR